MTPEEFSSLNTGDLVRFENEGNAALVLGNYGDHINVINHVDVSNPIEWLVNGERLTDVRTLGLGDILVHASGGPARVVIGGDARSRTVIAAYARTINAENCGRWTLAAKAEHRRAG